MASSSHILDFGDQAAIQDEDSAVEMTMSMHGASTAAMTSYLSSYGRAEELGWDNEPLVGPSSQCVDMNQYTTWTGAGARYDRILNMIEQRPIERHLVWQCNCIEEDPRNQ